MKTVTIARSDVIRAIEPILNEGAQCVTVFIGGRRRGRTPLNVVRACRSYPGRIELTILGSMTRAEELHIKKQMALRNWVPPMVTKVK